MQYYKANPRPPSAFKGRKGQGLAPTPALKDDSDGYSDENYDDNFDEDDGQADVKLDKLRKAMKKENTKANKMAE